MKANAMLRFTIATLNSVLKIRSGDGTGTAFFMSEGGTTFLVTAKHVVKNVLPTDKIALISFSDDRYIEVSDIEYGDDESDVAVIKLAEEVLPKVFRLETRSSGDNIIVGQEIAFAGFPLSLEPRYENLFGDKPMPLVKGGIFSGILKRPYNGNPELKPHPQYFFDAHNNRGFSGGPIFINSETSPLRPQRIKVIAVVSEYFKDAPLDDAEKIRPNSGFMVGAPIGNAVEAAKRIIDRTLATDPRGCA